MIRLVSILVKDVGFSVGAFQQAALTRLSQSFWSRCLGEQSRVQEYLPFPLSSCVIDGSISNA